MTFIGKDIETAAAMLANDQVIAIPTETVYGLAGNALRWHICFLTNTQSQTKKAKEPPSNRT